MPTNIEIKFRVNDLESVEHAATEHANSGPELLVQEDIFFDVNSGRLKLRKFDDGTAELIAYHRSNDASVRQSNWHAYKTSDPDGLQKALAVTLGQGITVRKRRTLYLIGNTRVHLDSVESLGQFVELEVVLCDDDTHESGLAIANDVIDKLGLGSAEKLSLSYADLLAAKG